MANPNTDENLHRLNQLALSGSSVCSSNSFRATTRNVVLPFSLSKHQQSTLTIASVSENDDDEEVSDIVEADTDGAVVTMLAQLSMTPTKTVNSFVDDQFEHAVAAKGKNSEIVVLVED